MKLLKGDLVSFLPFLLLLLSMIIITKGISQYIVLTLDEKATQEQHNYILKFTHVQSGQSKVLYSPDVSLTPERFNKFLIEETVNEDLVNGKVSLEPTGQWDYVAYEMPISSPQSLDASLAYGIVEEGRLFVKDSTENINVHFDSDDTKDTAVFDEQN